MKTKIGRILIAAALGLWTSAATAHHIAGTVICTDTTPATPLQGVNVTAQGGVSGTFTASTLADGSFFIPLPVATDTYTVTISVPPGLTITSPAGGQYSAQIFANGVGGPDHFDGANFELTGCGTPPPLGQIGDTVYCDANTNGVQDADEPGIPGVKVTLLCKDANSNIVASATATTDANGKYLFVDVPAGSCTVTVDASTVPAPCNVPGVCAPSVDHILGAGEIFLDADFCFTPQPPTGPGTGTPGYWMNHPEAWPVDSITVGGIVYSKDQAIAIMKKPVRKDARLIMFPQLVSAELNVLIGNDSSCIDATIAAADAWWATYNGSPVKASSAAWAVGGPLATTLDDYNNGRLCAPHRD